MTGANVRPLLAANRAAERARGRARRTRRRDVRTRAARRRARRARRRRRRLRARTACSRCATPRRRSARAPARSPRSRRRTPRSRSPRRSSGAAGRSAARRLARRARRADRHDRRLRARARHPPRLRRRALPPRSPASRSGSRCSLRRRSPPRRRRTSPTIWRCSSPPSPLGRKHPMTRSLSADIIALVPAQPASGAPFWRAWPAFASASARAGRCGGVDLDVRARRGPRRARAQRRRQDDRAQRADRPAPRRRREPSSLFGGDPRAAAVRRGLGVTPQDLDFPAMLRVHELVDLVRAHYPNPLRDADGPRALRARAPARPLLVGALDGRAAPPRGRVRVRRQPAPGVPGRADDGPRRRVAPRGVGARCARTSRTAARCC